ncbi:MAG TPA: hypothetical protein EYO33_20595, partial [Phycisphaerales bacterium]|nr:hypothetical protein [Phycisphaerales bacterium]
QNLGLFYIFFEAMLLPALVLIAGWSKVDAGKTALKFLIYTMVGSLPMLLAGLVLFFTGVGGESLEFSQMTLDPDKQIFLFYPFLLAFLVKMPIFPLHGWLPTLYKNAPPTVTAVIAALMSKAGTYGLFKVGLVVFPDAFSEVSSSLAVLAVASIIYGALTALGSDSVREVVGRCQNSEPDNKRQRRRKFTNGGPRRCNRRVIPGGRRDGQAPSSGSVEAFWWLIKALPSPGCSGPVPHSRFTGTTWLGLVPG